MATPISFFDLPWEVIVDSILPHVNLQTCFTLRQVCLDLRIIVALYFETLKKINLSADQLPPIIPRQVLDILLRSNAVCKTFILNVKFEMKFKIDDQTVEDCACDAILPPFFDRCRQLRNIDLAGSNSISSVCLKNIAFNCKQLESLNLSSCHWIDVEDVCKITSSCKRLLSLNLSSLWSIDDDALKAIVTHCPQLRHLSLENTYSISDRSMYELCKSCRNLLTLNIAGCRRISDAGIRALAEYGEGLATLRLSDGPPTSEVILGRFRKNGVRVDVSARTSLDRFFWPEINLEC